MTNATAQSPFEKTQILDVSGTALLSRKQMGSKARADRYDVATGLLIAALMTIALFTFKDYAISNDEGVQHRYGELILSYYKSGLTDRSVFHFLNLYLYGGLFDIVAIGISYLTPLDIYDLRHILCAFTGIAGIAAAAATARMIAGPRAGLLAALALSISGAWYGAIFNHTKDIPFATMMMAATFFLLRIGRLLPRPRWSDVVAFGLLMGAALGIRVVGLLLIGYILLVILLYLPWRERHENGRNFVLRSLLRILPAVGIAYIVMIAAWPWAALDLLNPIRGMLEFSEFHYSIRTLFEGKIYMMADVPPSYIPIYLIIREPLLILFGVALAAGFTLIPSLATAELQSRWKDILFIWLAVVIPITCQVVFHGPAFTGLRHFIFVLPLLAILAAIGIDNALTVLSFQSRLAYRALLSVVAAGIIWDGVTLGRLHPYEYLFYNDLVGGLQGASRTYDLDYWFSSMPEALGQLETYLRRTSAGDSNWPNEIYSVAVCGERLSFEKSVTLPQLRFDFKPQWNQSEFFISPTHMNCDKDLDGKIVGTVTRLGVPIAYIKDRRALTSTVATSK